MRIFTHGETPPEIPYQLNQAPLTFRALPYWTEDKEIEALSLSDEVLTNKTRFPIVEDFELVIVDGRQNPPDKHMGCDIFTKFVDRSKNLSITGWDMYSVDASGPERCVPIPTSDQVVYEMDAGYQILIVADEEFIYIAQAGDEMPPVYTRYCKVPRTKYESEWKEFVEWYHAHPEKQQSRPTPKVHHPNSVRSPAAVQQKRGSWLSRFFK